MSANPLWGPDWPAVRKLWHLDSDVVHLNHGSYGAPPAMVLAEQDRWRAIAHANPNGFFSRLLSRELGTVRERVSQFVGAKPGTLALQPNVSAAVAAVLRSVELHVDDEVLITNHCYRGVREAVDAACSTQRATVHVVDLPLDVLGDAVAAVERIVAGVGPRTRLAIVEHITSPTTAVINIRAVVSALRERGVIVAVDGAHAPGALPLEIDSVGADYYAGNLHKWCCAPPGAGFIVVAPHRQDEFRPAVVGSAAAEGFPAGVEWWGTADYSALLSVPSALALLDELGTERVRTHNTALASLGQQVMCDVLGTTPPGFVHASMSLVPLPPGSAASDGQARALRQTLAEELGIECVILVHEGSPYLRLSAHVYNCPADYQRLAEGLPPILAAATPGQRQG